MNIPNFISAIRIVLIPLFLYLIFVPRVEERIGALFVFIIASLTDFFDGWSARKLGQVTAFGKFLDPLADKFLVVSTIIAFLILDPLIPLWMILVIVFREILLTSMRYLAIRRQSILKTTRFGKIKTAFQMISFIIIIMVLIVRSSLGVKGIKLSGDDIMGFQKLYEVYNSNETYKWLIIAPYCLMAVVTVITALSGLRYILTNWRLFLPSTHKKEKPQT